MNGKAPPDRNEVTRTEGEGATVDLPGGVAGIAPGQVLGGRYQVLSLLGRGGMGEVWHALDLKLRVEVALKALRPEFFASERRLEMLRDEVRAAREVVSPNVCRIFDLIEIDGRELVSMEYVDGATLLAVLQERGPLELKEAQDIASQFLAGLEAIHKAGLIHRDIKPENIMITRAGRVVVMDFGLARQETEGGASVSGTPAYMAPEQAAGQTLDGRADVYAAGVVLAEMVCPEGIKSIQSRQSVWEAVRSEPAKLPDTPWAAVIKQAVAKDRERRFNTAHTLVRALEDVTLRVEGADDLHPYPGLASFTEADAEYFFGREAEVEQMWRTLEGPPRMLGLVGPSGAGKTSFLRAGLIPAATSGWACVVCTPGSDPRAALRRAVISELEGDTEALRELAEGSDEATVSAVARWRRHHQHAAVVVDQFEELFTQNSPDEQGRFAALLGRLVLDADVFVLLTMRDDFAAGCHQYEAFRPMFHDLTVLDPPSGAPLRRALTQPALQCGYRFEDDELVDQMLAEVEGERGALPLLAFAAARLWEKRDRQTGLLTRQAYFDIGGVGGALARHAEATIDRIGHERLPVVRELFRNLVTAESTRAVREWNELLSVFSESSDESHAAVLRSLIDARLLTSYEVREADKAPTRRVEIIHESLLANWPRLVRWQTQDADAAQLRDQLRQAARTWDEHERTDDMLWTGAAYREFASWRELYPGGLSQLEEAFASAMTTLATRRRRRRRVAAVAAVATALAIAAVFGTLWRRSVHEARRAEAAKLLALAQAQLGTDPVEALAYATASLDLADTFDTRVFAIRALSAGPPMVAIDMPRTGSNQYALPVFSPDGSWLAVGGLANENVLVYRETGGQPIVLGGHAASAGLPIRCAWTRDGLLVTGHESEGRARVWSLPGANLVRQIEFGGKGHWQIAGAHLYAEVIEGGTDASSEVRRLLRWRLPDGATEELGAVDWIGLGATSSCFDPSAPAWVYTKGDRVYRRPLPNRGESMDTVIASQFSGQVTVHPWPRPEGFFASDDEGRTVVWGEPSEAPSVGQRLRCPETAKTRLQPEPSGRWAVAANQAKRDGRALLWDVRGLPLAMPIELRRSGSWFFSFIDFRPGGDWIAAATNRLSEVSLWKLSTRMTAVIDGYSTLARQPVLFTPDGRFLATYWGQDRVRLWPMPGTEATDFRDLMLPDAYWVLQGLVIDPEGQNVLSTGYGDNVFVLSIADGTCRQLRGFPATDNVHHGAFSPSGRFVAAASMISDTHGTLRVWDLVTDEVRIFPQPAATRGEAAYYAYHLAFEDETTLYTAGGSGLLRWDLEDGTYREVLEAPPGGLVRMFMADGRQKMLSVRDSRTLPQPEINLHDLKNGTVERLHLGERLQPVFALDDDGSTWVAGGTDGLIRVGRIGGTEAHLLAGHEGPISAVAIAPDEKWIASSGEDKTLRLWPMPDLSKPPLHTLPHDELIAKLKSLTNLRAVRDPESSTGWKIQVGPFPGWAEVPEW